MLKNRASAEGTAAYAQRFAALPGNFRPMLQMSVGSIGLGTYLGEPDPEDDAAYEAAITAALRGGVNLLDSAVNYRFQRSERTIGRALAALAAKGEIEREEVVVATKGGYLSFDGEAPADPRAWLQKTFIQSGIIKPEELAGGSHCMAPRYLRLMIETSLQNLGLETIDIYYLHNPESQLDQVDPAEFRKRLSAAFEMLETQVAEGRIGVYGAATWNGFRVPTTERGYLSLSAMLKAAREVGGPDHHFRVVQMPYNLAMPEAITLANQWLSDTEAGTMLACAQAAGVAICASATLLQGRLARGLPGLMAEAFPGFETDAQRALQFVRSTPGVNVALVGMKSIAHVKENLATANQPPAPFEALMKLFKRS